MDSMYRVALQGTNPKPFVAMTVAGSDSGGGAGIQADLKTFAALGVYGTSTVTAVTAQNTVGVRQAVELPGAIIETVAAKAEEHRLKKLVVDPVMIAKSGDRLLREDAVSALARRLIPLADVVTPNLQEAEGLVGFPVRDPASMRRAAKATRGGGGGGA